MGDHVRHLRLDRGWKIRQLAELSGVSRSTISQIEQGTGNPTLENLLRLQHAFSLDSIEGLLGVPPSAGMASVVPGAPIKNKT